MAEEDTLTKILTLVDNAVGNGFDYFGMVGRKKKQPRKVASHDLDYRTQILTIWYDNGSSCTGKIKERTFDEGILTTKEFVAATYGKPKVDVEAARIKKVRNPLAYLYTEHTLAKQAAGVK